MKGRADKINEIIIQLLEEYFPDGRESNPGMREAIACLERAAELIEMQE